MVSTNLYRKLRTRTIYEPNRAGRGKMRSRRYSPPHVCGSQRYNIGWKIQCTYWEKDSIDVYRSYIILDGAIRIKTGKL